MSKSERSIASSIWEKESISNTCVGEKNTKKYIRTGNLRFFAWFSFDRKRNRTIDFDLASVDNDDDDYHFRMNVLEWKKKENKWTYNDENM